MKATNTKWMHWNDTTFFAYTSLRPSFSTHFKKNCNMNKHFMKILSSMMYNVISIPSWGIFSTQQEKLQQTLPQHETCLILYTLHTWQIVIRWYTIFLLIIMLIVSNTGRSCLLKMNSPMTKCDLCYIAVTSMQLDDTPFHPFCNRAQHFLNSSK